MTAGAGRDAFERLLMDLLAVTAGAQVTFLFIGSAPVGALLVLLGFGVVGWRRGRQAALSNMD